MRRFEKSVNGAGMDDVDDIEISVEPLEPEANVDKG
jgi:hypothetical protein